MQIIAGGGRRSGELEDDLMRWRRRWCCCYDLAAVVLAIDGSPLVHSVRACVRACKKGTKKGLSRQLLKGYAIHAIAYSPPRPILTLDHYTRAKGAALCCAGPNLISHAGSVAALYHPDI